MSDHPKWTVDEYTLKTAGGNLQGHLMGRWRNVDRTKQYRQCVHPDCPFVEERSIN